MKKIFKYNLNKIDGRGHMILDVPMPAEILSVSEQYNEAVIYAMGDEGSPTIPVDILIVETDQSIKDDMDTYKFIGTVKLDNGKYIHLFYRYVDIIGDAYIIPQTNKERFGRIYREKGEKGELLIA